ncbi:MAG: diguanylate cyclase [Candidatus Omnitrophota bacterium]|nr:diguanylate cyclase [Candidatus Omnitrophota bacterium]
MNIKEKLGPFIARRGQLKVIYVATCNENGHPNCAPRLIIDIEEPNKIFYIDFKRSQSHENICQTKRASLAFMDEKRLMSFKIDGLCETVSSGTVFDRVKARWTKMVNAYHAERIIERLRGVISGRVGEIVLSDDYVIVQFNAREMRKVIVREPSTYPMGKIASLQLHIDELEKDVEKYKEGERVMEVSRDSYRVTSDLFETAAMEDNLTGLYNQRGFIMLVEQQLKISKRQKKETFLIFSDVDHLKRINDTFGHAKGDEALVNVARILKRSFRDSDIIARIGGDEFAVAMVDCGKEYLDVAKSRLRENIAEQNRTTKEPYSVEISIGVASCKPNDTVNLNELLSQSDQRMYEEKRKKK